MSGQLLGLQLPLQGGRPLKQDYGVMGASLLVLIPEPTTLAGHTLLSSFSDVGGVTGAAGGEWGAGDPPPVSTQVPALRLWTGAANFGD